MNVLIAGGDPTGAELARMLLDQNHRVTLIEHRPEILAQLHAELPTEVIYEGRSTDLTALEGAKVGQVDVLVACTASDTDNLVLCYLAHQVYQVPRTIGRINNPRHAWLFDHQLHVDVALNESSILAHLIGEEMSLGDMMTLLKLRRGQYSLVEVVVPAGAKAAGNIIRDLALPEQCVIVAILRKGDMVVPHGSTQILEDDVVLTIADPTSAEVLAGLFTVQHSNGAKEAEISNLDES